VARAISRNIFENQGSSWKFVDCRIIVEKDKGLNEKLARIFGLELFSNGERCDLGPWLMDRGSGRFTVDQGHGHGGELTGAPTPGRLRPWGSMRDGEKEEGATGVRFCLLLRLGRRCTSGSALA
jgi:hypothetical protein